MKGIFLRLGCIFILWAVLMNGPLPVWIGLDEQGQGLPTLRAGAARQTASISWDDYWKQVQDAHQLIIALAQVSAEQARRQLDELALQWEALTSVELPDGRVMAVNHSYLVALLRSSPPDLARCEHMLAALLAERENIVAGQFTEDDRNSLNRILALSEFQWKEQSGQTSELEKLWQRLREAWEKLLTKLMSFEGSDYVIGFGAVLFLTLGLLFLFRHLLFGFVAEARITPPTRTGDEILTADTALKQAQNLSHEGDYRNAVRYLYLSALLLLEERGLLGHDRTKTNREYLRSLSGQPELAAPLQNVVDVFDRVWYGYQPLTDQDYQYYERQVGKLRQQRKHTPPKTEGE